MRCVNCGNELEPGSRFCVNCGTPVGQGQQTSAPGTAPGQGVSPGSMGGMNAPQKAVVRQKSKKMSPAIIVVIIVVIVGVMAAAGYGIGRFVLSDDPGSDTKTSESKESTKDEEKSEKEDSSSGEDADQEEFTLEGVDKDNVADYDNILSKSKYKSFNDGDFSFIYPIGFFNNVEKTTDGETVKYDFTSTDENTELVYEKTPEQGISENTIISLSEGKNTELYDVDFYPYKKGKPYLGTNEKLKGKKFQGYYPIDPEPDDNIHGIVSGFVDPDHKGEEYNYFISDGSYVYTMRIKTKGGLRVGGEDNRAGYLVDCLYRKLSKTNSSLDMTSYKQYLEDVKNGKR